MEGGGDVGRDGIEWWCPTPHTGSVMGGGRVLEITGARPKAKLETPS